MIAQAAQGSMGQYMHQRKGRIYVGWGLHFYGIIELGIIEATLSSSWDDWISRFRANAPYFFALASKSSGRIATISSHFLKIACFAFDIFLFLALVKIQISNSS